MREFEAKWKGFLHHVTGVHIWVLGEGYSNCCDHGEIDEGDDIPKLFRNGPADQALKRII